MSCFCSAPLNNNVVITTCGHSFHDACIRQWLRDHTYCPTCRATINAAGLRASATIQDNGPFRLTFTDLNGLTFNLTGMNEGTRVEDLKPLVTNAIGLAPQHQNLLFKGKMLDAGRVLKDYGIRSGDTVHIVNRQAGGA